MWCASIGDAITWLKREVVPACLAWEASARLLRAGAKNVFGEEERGGWKVLMMAALLTKDSGFATDAGRALDERVKVVINSFIGWFEKTSAMIVDGQTGPDVTLLKDLDQSIKDSYAAAVNARNDLRKSSVCLFTADKAVLSRNPFVDEHQPQTASLPDVWVHSHPQNGTMRGLGEIMRCCRIEGSLTAMANVLRVIAGPFFAEEDGVRMVKGSPNANYGAMAFFSVYGGATEATKHLELWMQAVQDAPVSPDLRLPAVARFVGAGKPKGVPAVNHKRYVLPLGENFVPDAYAAQAIRAVQKACDDSNGGGDHVVHAQIVSFNFDLQTESGKASAVYVDVEGELCTRSRYLEPIHGKTATLQEVVVAPEMEQLFVYLENSCRDQNGRQAIVSMLLDKARLGEDGVEVSEDRDRRNIVIVGALCMKLPAAKHKDLMRMVRQIDAGVPARNSGYIELSPEEALAARVVGKNVKVYTGSSPSALMHTLREAGVAWTEVGSGGGMASSALAAELEAFKQQTAEQERAAQERADQIAQALQHVRTQATAQAAAAETQAQTLRSDLRAAYELMEANRREEAAKVELNARRAEAERAEQAHQLSQIQQAATTHAAVLMALLQGNPQVALGLRDVPALEGSNAAQVVVGQNGDNGEELIFDVNALVAPINGPRQGGAAAPPLPEAVQKAQEAEEHARVELQLAQEARRTARDLAAARVERPSGLSQEMEDTGIAGAHARVVSGAAVGGLCNGQGRRQGGSMGGSNGDFECKWLPILSRRRQHLSDAATDGARRDEPPILHGTPMLRMVWAVMVAWALMRRMWRQLGRQYASVHKARRKKAVSLTACLSVSLVVGLVVRALVTCGTLVALPEGSMLLWVTGGASGRVVWRVQHDMSIPVTVTPPGQCSCNTTVTFRCNGCSCNSRGDATVAGALGARNRWHATTVPTTTAVGRRGTVGDGWIGDWAPSGVELRRVDAAGTQTVGVTARSAVGRGSDVSVVPLMDRTATGVEGLGAGARGLRAWCKWLRRMADGTEWWQVQGGAPPAGLGVHLGSSASDSHAMTRGESRPCRGPEVKAGPEAEDGEYSRGTSEYLAGCLRWTCCTGVANPDDHCCVLALQRPVGRSGQSQDKWRGATGGVILGRTPPVYMNLAMALLMVLSYCRARGRDGGSGHARRRGRGRGGGSSAHAGYGSAGRRLGRSAGSYVNGTPAVLAINRLYWCGWLR